MKAADQTTGSTMNLTETTTTSNSRLLLILVIVLGAVAIIAVIMAAVAVGRPAGSTVTVNQQPVGNTAQASDKTSINGKRIWTITHGNNFGAYHYVDEEGYIRGFTFKLVEEVCKAAEIECRTIWDKTSNCWNSEAGQHSMGGRGLLDGWYDACSAWYPTVGRIQVFSFSEPWGVAKLAYFYVKPGDSTFNPKDITGKKIGFIDGWAYDEKCLAREKSIAGGSPMDLPNIIHIVTPQLLIDKIVSGEIDAGFIGEENMVIAVSDNKVKKVGDSVSCMQGGPATMARKDSKFIDHWNRGFRIIKENGKFETICKTDEHKSKGIIECQFGE